MGHASKSANLVFFNPNGASSKGHQQGLECKKIKVFDTVCHLVGNLCIKLKLFFLLFIEAGLKRIIGSGACLSRNPVLRTEFQEIYHMPVEFTNEGSACIGAALSTIDVHHSS